MDKETLDYMMNHMPTLEEMINAYEKRKNNIQKMVKAYDDMDSSFEEYKSRVTKQRR